MMVRIRAVPVLLLFTSLLVPGAPAQEATFHYVLEDAPFDEATECTAAWDPDLNGACDILGFAFGNDGETAVAQFTMGTITWPNAATQVNIRLRYTDPLGAPHIVQARISFDGSVASASFGSDPGPAPSGIEWTSDTATNTVTATFPLASVDGAVPGASIQVDGIESRLGTAAATLTAIMDAIDDPPAIPIVGDAAGEAAQEARKVFEDLTAPAFLHDFDNATSDDYTLNFTVPWQNVTIRQTAEVVSGSANVTVLRDGEVFMALLLTNQTAPAGNGAADGNATDDNGTAPDAPVLRDVAGNWSVVIDYEGFVGTLGIELAEHVPSAPVETNATDEPTLDADVHEDAPGPALPLLVLGLLAVVVARRRD